MNRMLTYISWFALAIAIGAWAGVIYGSSWLQEEARERGSQAHTAEQRTAQAAQDARVRSLASDTRLDRERLEGLTRSDIVELATAIEDTGESVGVDARVSTAIPSGVTTELPGGTPLQRLAFIVQAEGTFGGVVQLVRALGAFPGFSDIDQFEFERLDSEQAVWRTTLRLQIYTTSDIAS